MADHEKLVDMSTKGLACLCFRNHNKLSMEKITEIFSRYGDVVRINCAANEDGFRFVRYRTKEDALRAAIALDGHRDVRLQTVKNKNKKPHPNDEFTNNKQTNFNDQGNDQTRRNVKETEKADSVNGSQSSKNSRKNNNQRQNNGSHKNRNGYDGVSNINSRLSREHLDTAPFPSNDQNSTRQFNAITAQNFVKGNEFGDKKGIAPNQNTLDQSKLLELHKRRGTIANTFQPTSNGFAKTFQPTSNGFAKTFQPTSNGIAKTFQSTNNGLSNTLPVAPSARVICSPLLSQHSTRSQSVMSDAPPPLVVDLPQAGEKGRQREVVVASDVIVANLHPNIGVSNVYQMLKKFSPIYVSNIEIVPDINVRFCYVYFNKPIDASLVEQFFDGVPVCGLNLIALRSHRLEAETGIL